MKGQGPAQTSANRLMNPITVRKNPVLVAAVLLVVAYGLGAALIVLPIYLAGMALSGANPAHPTASAHDYLGGLGIAYTLVFVLAMIRFRAWIAPWPRK